MTQKTRKIAGWILMPVLALMFGMSAFMKLSANGEALSQAAAYGMDPTTFRLIGILELSALVLFLYPRTGVIGSLLLIAYMGGAIVTHLQHNEPIATAIVIQVLVWVTAFIRFPELQQRLLPVKNARKSVPQ